MSVFVITICADSTSFYYAHFSTSVVERQLAWAYPSFSTLLGCSFWPVNFRRGHLVAVAQADLDDGPDRRPGFTQGGIRGDPASYCHRSLDGNTSKVGAKSFKRKVAKAQRRKGEESNTV